MLSRLSRTVSRLTLVRVTVVYAAALTAVSIALVLRGPAAEHSVIRHASTNLHNLHRGHLGTLLDSAFVVDAGPVIYWLPGLVCLLALGELQFRSARLVVAFATAHLGATVLVAVGLLIAVRHGLLPPAVSRAEDVGMSYGAVGVLGALSAAIPRPARPLWVAGWIGVVVGAAAVLRDFTSVGHGIALALGMLVSTAFGPAGRWTPLRWAMLSVAAAFGFLVLADGAAAFAVAGASGVACVLGAGLIVTQRNSAAVAMFQSARQESAPESSSNAPGVSHS